MSEQQATIDPSVPAVEADQSGNDAIAPLETPEVPTRFYVRVDFNESSLQDVRLRFDMMPNVEDVPSVHAKIRPLVGKVDAELQRVREEFFTNGEGRKVSEIESRVAETEAVIGKLSIDLGQAERDWAAALASGADAAKLTARRRKLKDELADANDSLAILQPALARAEGEARKRYAAAVRQRYSELYMAANARIAATRATIGELISEHLLELAKGFYELKDLNDIGRGIDRRVEKF